MRMLAHIQAITSILLVIITGVYVVFTHKMIHSARKTYLKPISINMELDRIGIKVKNIGPNIALNVKVSTTLMKNPILDEKNRKLLYENKVAIGAFELKPEETRGYYFESGFTSDLKKEITITWTSVTGKTQKSKWRYSLDNGERFIIC